MSKDLPSIDDFGADENLPSIEDFITEEKVEELPSVEDFIEEEEVIEEATQTIEDADGNSFAEVKDIVPPWPELVRMINDVRSDIPDIPEVKYYDQELQDLAEQISKLPEVRYYDREVEAICEQIDAVREQVKDLPEVKYYDEQVDAIEDRIDSLQTDVANLPEVKYYDAEIEAICEAIDQVKASIPKFPKWVNEVNEVPDFSWIGKTFSVIDDDFIKVNDHIDTLRERVDFNLRELSEDIDKKKFEAKVELDTKSEEIEAKIKEEKDKIWKEMRESSLRIWEYHKEFKDDDRKLKKQILGEYNSLKKSIDKKVNEVNENSVKTDKLLLDYFEDLRNEISSLPEVKYYDDDIRHVRTDIKDLYKLVEDIKSSQKKLQEEQQVLSETNVQFGEDPPNTSNADPLTPLDQNFVTLDQLQQHYKTFVQRVQYQLSSIGGGGAGFIKDLDDVDISGLADSYILQYDASVSKWKTVVNSGVGAGGTWATTTVGIHTVKNVGIGTTARSDYALYVEGNQYIDGSISVGGTITYEDVKNVDSIGIVTARSGIRIGTGGTVGPVGSGIVTYFGDGSQLTGIPRTSIRRQVETSSGVTTDFTITDGYTAGFIDVFLNGVKQRSGTDFTATNETSVTMVPAVNDGDVLEFQVYENLTVGTGNTYSGTSGQLLQHNGSDYVGVSSVGLATFFNDRHQGYYRYSTNFYTTGVANTVQTLPADEFVMIQPSVRTNKTDYMPQVMLDANNGDPWVGSGATVGTGQTEFSLAGLDEGSTVIVRIASQFNPDDDNTNLDFALNFTTNPTTQGYGTTNFSITREQALICNEGADQNYISEILMNFYVGSSLSGLTTTTAGTFNISARSSNEGDLEMMALTINVVA